MSEIILRPYQKDFIDAVRNEFVRLKRAHQKACVVGVAPCGAGKTIMTGWMIREATRKGRRSIFFVHRQELIDQTAQTFSDLGINFGIIAAGEEMNLSLPVQIASVQTLAKRVDQVPAPDFLICDECHHILANTYKTILDAYPNAYLLGVTATPQRMGGVTLCDVFNSMVESLSVQELIDLKNLTPFKYYAPEIGVDLHRVRKKFGEFVNADLEEVMSDKRIIGGIVKHYRELADGKSAICYCVNVNHSKNVAAAFNTAGISAAHIDGETPKNIRSQLVQQFRDGEIKVLCNAELFGEGFDVPHCQAVILARPTNSLTLYIQQAMRAMRPDPADPNKIAIIIDHVQNYMRHGFPNEDHDWTLEPNKLRNFKRYCPMCKKKVKVKITFKNEEQCPICGYIFPRTEIDKDDEDEHENDGPDTTEYEGKLIEFDTQQDEKKSASVPRIKRAFTKPEEFLTIAKERKYKIGWVALQSLEYAQSYEDCLHIAEVCGYKQGWAYHKWQERAAEIFDGQILQSARLSC